MDRPRITTIDGNVHDLRFIDGRAYRIVSEFDDDMPKIADSDFIERHAAIIAEFYDGVTVEDVLDMPLEDILPASIDVRSFVINNVWAKTKVIAKNAPADEATEQ